MYRDKVIISTICGTAITIAMLIVGITVVLKNIFEFLLKLEGR